MRVENWARYMKGGHTMGPADAPITILLYGDYECPFCARFEVELSKALAAYPAEIRVVYKHWPLPQHRFAYPAARAAECAGVAGRFSEMHHLLYQKKDSLGLLAFDAFATRAGVTNLDAFNACYQKPGPLEQIEATITEAREIGLSGTPGVIINGVRYERVVDFAQIEQLVQRARSK